jgi:hypothetical protein
MTSRVAIHRLDKGPTLVIDDAAALAYDFFSQDSSSVGPESYDASSGRTDANRITVDDVRAINRTMRARSPHSAWEVFTAAAEALPWLQALDPSWDLIAMEQPAWEATSCGELLAAAISASVGPYRQLSVATKVLHLKRPRLFPVLDSLVLEQLGAVGRTPLELLVHLRHQGQANIDALSAAQHALAKRGIDRPLVRILDALLWMTHPGAGLASKLPGWTHVIRKA